VGRIGLVLGAGGVIGGAFHAGVLAGLEEATGWDPRTAEIIVGTSAGSIAGAVLRAGLSAPDAAARLSGKPLSLAGAALLRSAGLPPGPPSAAGRPGPRPRWGPSAPQVLLNAARRPWEVRLPAVMAGLIPEGMVPTTVISDSIRAFLGDQWPPQPLWVVAVRLHDAASVVFGRGDSDIPTASPADAVAASCAIPGWFAPVRIAGARYVDGGVHSLTNVAQLARADVDLVLVSAPLGRAGQAGSRPGFRQAARAQLAWEALALRRRGIPVAAFQPTVEDRAVMGPDPMDASRRAPVVEQARMSTLARLRLPEFRRRLDALKRR
jgi:NTE family protein